MAVALLKGSRGFLDGYSLCVVVVMVDVFDYCRKKKSLKIGR